MIRKIIKWWKLRRPVTAYEDNLLRPETYYTREQLENAYRLGYTDGRKDGLTIAREQATKSLKEILWQQNKPTKQK